MTAVYRICVVLAMILLVDSATGENITEPDPATGAPITATTSSAATVVTTAVTQAPPTCNASNIANCAKCSGDAQTPVCVECNAFYELWNTTSCLLCNSTIPNCSTCSNSTACTSCSTGYGLNITKQCQMCPVLIPHCVVCATDAQKCSRCAATFRPTATSDQCEACDVANCNNCTAVKGQCDYGGCQSGYFLNENQNCTAAAECNTEIANCVTCESITVNNPNVTCSQCKAKFAADASRTICTACDVANCNTCTLDKGQCDYGGCQSGYFLNENKNCSAAAECNTEIANCVTCVSITINNPNVTCSLCKEKFAADASGTVCNAEEPAPACSGSGFDAASFVGGIVLGCGVIIIVVVVTWYCRKGRTGELSYSQF